MPSPAMILGSAIDCKVLTSDQFEKRFVILEKPTGKGSVAEWADILQKAAESRLTVLKKDQYETVLRCKEALHSHKDSADLLAGMFNQQRKLKWHDKENDLPLTGYLDFESKAWDSDFIVDLKTSSNADPDQFEKDAAKYDYPIQCGMYLDAMHKIRFKFPYFIFLVVETDEPFNVSVNFIEADVADFCKDLVKDQLKRFRYCMDNNLWHQGYEFRLMQIKKYHTLSIPRWYK